MKAVIDIGTNTFHLNIANVLPNNKIVFIYKTYKAVKLGEGGINQGIITPDAYKRGVNALLIFNKTIAKYPVGKVIALATSAVRDAQNGEEFIADILQKTGISIQTISGDKEAELIYEGTKAALNLTKNTFLIMDIGGGSVEFILCNQTQIFWKQSFKIGAARLMDLFMKNDPLLQVDIQSIENHLNLNLFELFEACETFKPQVLVGTAGSFESYTEIINTQNGLHFNPNKQKSYPFNNQELVDLLNFF